MDGVVKVWLLRKRLDGDVVRTTIANMQIKTVEDEEMGGPTNEVNYEGKEYQTCN